MTLREKADNLNISPHTLRNWQKRKEASDTASRNLVSRANKLNSFRLTLAVELLHKKENKGALQDIRDILLSQPLQMEGRILLFALYYLNSKKLLSFPTKPSSRDCLAMRINQAVCAPVMQKELTMRLNQLSENEQRSPLSLPESFSRCFHKNLLKETDLPGLIYQSIQNEGARSRRGAWFTPVNIIDSMINPYKNRKKGLFDPCCGSGLFLCRFAEMKGSADCVRGMDMDPLSVFLTRLNLFTRFPLWTAFQNIQEGDSLKVSSWFLGAHDLVATNPPWGAHMGEADKKEMLFRYPEIQSGESASLFLRRCSDELPPGGTASFLLPESLFYVEIHKDIRTWLLEKAPPVKITDRGKLFKGVYSAVVSCDFSKDSSHRKVRVISAGVETKGREGEKQLLSRYKKNTLKIINFQSSREAQALIHKIKNGRTRSLPEDCLWLLGVVTGDNARFISETPQGGAIPLLTGKELAPFGHKPVCRYLKTDDGPYQQNRPLEEYGRPKLAYRFIGYKPVFSLDREGLITLNSANGLIPPREEDLEELAFWYNSSLFRFLWFNQYRSVKMLRHHLEQLPLPQWKKIEIEGVRKLVKEAENRQDVQSLMDEMIFRHFKLTNEEIKIVFSQI
ncbi:N-6 DNA methylase [Oceanispirochaeta sp.]|jgi:hypothetical protein|uniref:N-6 DNA methylase n=1 Tax=Oceanispirochaeta sp. TaxID=2035350 RepID=UPI00262F8FED|nr:N-6 DNA methylase [Oceanispirochaeta sp.]